jgi:hypothetical protein
MLETAPRSESDVLYPEWGDTVSDTARVEGPHGQYRTRSYDSLESYLLANGLDYELLPGDYVMIRLKHKIHFNTASSKVSSQSAQWLSQLGYFLSKQEGIDVVIGGHTDNTGNVNLTILCQKNELKGLNRHWFKLRYRVKLSTPEGMESGCQRAPIKLTLAKRVIDELN